MYKLGCDGCVHDATDMNGEFETLFEQEQEVRRQSNVYVQARL